MFLKSNSISNIKKFKNPSLLSTPTKVLNLSLSVEDLGRTATSFNLIDNRLNLSMEQIDEKYKVFKN